MGLGIEQLHLGPSSHIDDFEHVNNLLQRLGDTSPMIS